MAATSGIVPPPISWAQRNDLLYVIIDVECKDIDYKVLENSFTFKGVNALDPTKKYDVTINFSHKVDPKKVSFKNIGRCLEFTIYKAESGPYWKSLSIDGTKLHFLKANFTKWKNESDDEEEVGNENALLSDVLNGCGMENGFDDFNVDDDDDSDDNIPSLSHNEESDEDEKNISEKKKDEH